MKIKPIEVKIDLKTLPIDGAKVMWQTQEDFDKHKWKQGIYSSDNGNDNTFCVGFNSSANEWDCDIDVIHWYYLDILEGKQNIKARDKEYEICLKSPDYLHIPCNCGGITTCVACMKSLD